MGRKSRRKKQRIISNASPASKTLRIVAYLCLIVGICSFYGSITQFHHLDNTRNGVGFFLLFAFLGLLISLPFYVVIYKTVLI
jgi:hypothetical protein